MSPKKLRHWIFLNGLILLVHFSGHASNHYFMSSGGGEAGKPTNMFQPSAQAFANLAGEIQTRANGDSAFLIYDGEHESHEQVFRDLSQPKLLFTQTNFAKQIDNLIAKVESGEIKDGDNIILMLDTHGNRSFGDQREVKSLFGDLDIAPHIRRLQNSIKGKGIHLGLIDDSCYSGKSQIFANEQTCVVSSADDHSAYNGFSISLLEQMKPGVSLEDAYLGARQKYNYPSTPRISTAPDRWATESLRGIRNFIVNEFSDVKPHLHSANEQCFTPAHIERTLTSIRSIISSAESLSSALVPKPGRSESSIDIFRALLSGNQDGAPSVIDDKSQEILRESIKRHERARVDLSRIIPEWENFDNLSTERQQQLDFKYRRAMYDLQSSAIRVREVENAVYESLYRRTKGLESADHPCKKIKF